MFRVTLPTSVFNAQKTVLRLYRDGKTLFMYASHGGEDTRTHLIYFCGHGANCAVLPDRDSGVYLIFLRSLEHFQAGLTISNPNCFPCCHLSHLLFALVAVNLHFIVIELQLPAFQLCSYRLLGVGVFGRR